MDWKYSLQHDITIVLHTQRDFHDVVDFVTFHQIQIESLTDDAVPIGELDSTNLAEERDVDGEMSIRYIDVTSRTEAIDINSNSITNDVVS